MRVMVRGGSYPGDVPLKPWGPGLPSADLPAGPGERRKRDLERNATKLGVMSQGGLLDP